MNKSKKIENLVGSIILVLLVVTAGIMIYRAFYKNAIVCNDIEEYKSGKYIIYDHGEYASEFLPKYFDLENYNSIDFYVSDGRRKTTPLHKYYTNYTLEIKYDDNDAFNEKVESLKSEYDNYLVTSWEGKHDVYMVKNLDMEENQIACFAINEESKMIRYAIFFVDNEEFDSDISKEVFLTLMVDWNSPVDW